MMVTSSVKKRSNWAINFTDLYNFFYFFNSTFYGFEVNTATLTFFVNSDADGR